MGKFSLKVWLIIIGSLLVMGLFLNFIYPEIPGGIILILLSCLLLGILLFQRRTLLKESISIRSARYGTNSLVFIVILAGIFVASNMLAVQHNLRLDMTTNKLFSLSDKTKEVLKLVQDPLEVYAFLSKNDTVIRKNLHDLVDTYTDVNHNIKLTVIDPVDNPLKARDFWISEKDNRRIIFRHGNLETRVATIDENSFTNAILKVYKKNDYTIYFSTGHDEGNYQDNSQLGYQILAHNLEDLGYKVQDTNLNMALPKDCRVLVILSPRYKFNATETDILKQYLAGGGNIILLLDPTVVTHFTEFLEDYGVYPQDKLVIDDVNYINDKAFPIVTTYSGHAITEVFNRKNIKTFYPLVVPVMGASKPSLKTQYTPLALSSVYNSWALSQYNLKKLGNYLFDNQKGDLKGPLPVAGLVELTNKGNLTGHLIVWGDSEFVNNTYYNLFGNGALFLNAVNWLVGDNDLIQITRKLQTGKRFLALSSQDHNFLFYLFVIFIPGLLLITGGALWWQKRKR